MYPGQCLVHRKRFKKKKKKSALLRGGIFSSFIDLRKEHRVFQESRENMCKAESLWDFLKETSSDASCSPVFRGEWPSRGPKARAVQTLRCPRRARGLPALLISQSQNPTILGTWPMHSADCVKRPSCFHLQIGSCC